MKSLVVLLGLPLVFFALADASVFAWELAKNDILQRSPTQAYYQFRKILRQDGRSVTMDLFLFDTRRCRLRVLDQGDQKAARRFANLGEAMTQEDCLAGCNGSYFDKAFFPLGLVVDDGAQVHGYGTSPLLTGTLATDGQQAHMLWRGEGSRLRQWRDALQAGPRLVDRKLPAPGLSNTKQRRRTFALTDGAAWWGIGICRSLTLKELGDVLADRRLIPEIDIARALNLDGGSSSAFWVRGNSGQDPTYIREWSLVRNYVGIVARNSSQMNVMP